MTLQVRLARPDDLPTIANLTAKKRRQLATWEPCFWAMAEGSDERHRAWLAGLVSSVDIVTRVAVNEDDAVLGFVVCLPKPDGWVVDDVCVADHRWEEVGAALANAVVERPARTCVPHADIEQAKVFRRAGWDVVSHYRVLRLTGRAITPAAGVAPGRPERLAPAPIGTFPFDPADERAIVLVDEHGGHVVGSPPFPPPGIYAPGGTTCVVDRVTGPQRNRLLGALLALAQDRGNVQAIVVCGADDEELKASLDADGWRHPVDVFAILP